MLELQAKKRTVFGKKVNELIEKGIVPAIAYGHGFENIDLEVTSNDLRKIYKEAGENSLVNILVDGETFPVLIYELQTDAVSGKIIHADFFRVNLKEKIRTEVPLVYVGESPAVKEFGGVFVKAVDELEVEALPSDIPHNIEVDISVLKEIHQSIHVKDLSLPKNIKIFADLSMTLATIIEKAKEEEVVAPAVEAEAVATEAQLEAEGQKTEQK